MSTPPVSGGPSPSAVRPVAHLLAQLLSRGAHGGLPGAPGSGAPAPAPPGPPAGPAWVQALASLNGAGASLGELITRVGEQTRGPVASAGGSAPPLAELRAFLTRLEQLDEFDGEMLRDRVERSGLHLEARVAQQVRSEGKPAPGLAQLLDLKAALLRAQAALPDGPLRQELARGLAGLEEQQLHNLARAEQGESPVLAVPLPDGDGWTTAWLQQRGGGGGDSAGGDDESARLSFGVTFSALGPIRAELALNADSLRGRIAVGREPVRRALESELGAIAARLQRDGRAVQLTVVLVEEADLAGPASPIDGHLNLSA